MVFLLITANTEFSHIVRPKDVNNNYLTGILQVPYHPRSILTSYYTSCIFFLIFTVSLKYTIRNPFIFLWMVMGGLKPVGGYTLNQSPLHHRANKAMLTVNLASPINLTSIFLDSGRKYRERHRERIQTPHSQQTQSKNPLALIQQFNVPPKTKNNK